MTLTEREQQVIRSQKGKMPYSRLAIVLGRSRLTIAKYAKACSGVTKKQRKENPSIHKRRNAIVRLAKKTTRKGDRVFPTYSSSRAIASALFRELNISICTRTVARDLVIRGFVSRVRPNVPTRNRKDIAQRVQFCRSMTRVNTKKLLFCDECWVTSVEETGRRQWVQKKTRPLPIEKKSRYNCASIMIWACIGHNFRSPLVIFPKKAADENAVYGSTSNWTLRSKSYVRRCLSTISSHMKRNKLTLVQDGARCHVSSWVKDYASRNNLQIEWKFPASSPDYNVIENLWSVFKKNVGAKCPLNDKELVAAAKEAWTELPVSLINNLVASFKSRMEKGSKEEQV